MTEKTIEESLQAITDYWISIERNTVNGLSFMKIGLPNSWVFKDSEHVSCEILKENDSGKLIKVSSKDEATDIDHIVSFVKRIIETNQKIASEEKKFTEKIEKIKKSLEDEAKSFYEGIEKMKNDSFEELKKHDGEKNTDVKRGRPPKNKGKEKEVKKETNEKDKQEVDEKDKQKDSID